MADFPYFPFYPRDYLADTQHLTTEQHGAYLLLLAQMWLRKDCALPAEDEFLCRIAGVSKRRWPSIWKAIGGFFSFDGDRIFQKRLSTERKNVSVFSKKAAQAANVRWLKEKEKSDASASSGQCPIDANQKQRQKQIEDSPPLVPPAGGKPKSKRGSRLADHLGTNGTTPPCPPEYLDAADELGAIAGEQWPRFYDYWLAQPGQRGVKLDWLATWRNWCRKSIDVGPMYRAPPQNLGRVSAAIYSLRDFDDE